MITRSCGFCIEADKFGQPFLMRQVTANPFRRNDFNATTCWRSQPKSPKHSLHLDPENVVVRSDRLSQALCDVATVSGLRRMSLSVNKVISTGGRLIMGDAWDRGSDPRSSSFDSERHRCGTRVRLLDWQGTGDTRHIFYGSTFLPFSSSVCIFFCSQRRSEEDTLTSVWQIYSRWC